MTVARMKAEKQRQDGPIVEVRAHTDAVDDHRVTFLDTFTPDEQKKIIRNVDYRTLIIIGVIYLVKQVRPSSPSSAA